VPEALGFFTLAFPALKRWAFLFRPAERDWGAPQQQICHREPAARREGALLLLGDHRYIFG